MSESDDNLPVSAGENPAGGADAPLVERDEKGRFVKGRSGNPAGRQKGQRNRIKELQTAHELALREYITDPERQEKVLASLDNLFRIAAGGTEDQPVENNHAVSAAKLILDRLMPKVAAGDEGGGGGPRQLIVEIQNNTGDAGIGHSGVTIDMQDPEDD